jgi:hypothetical protein
MQNGFTWKSTDFRAIPASRLRIACPVSFVFSSVIFPAGSLPCGGIFVRAGKEIFARIQALAQEAPAMSLIRSGIMLLLEQ